MECVLKLELYRYKNVVFGSVQHQDDQLRSEIGEQKVLTKPDAVFRIISKESPELEGNTLYICGHVKDKDNKAFSVVCTGEIQAEKLADTIREAVEYVNMVFKPFATKEIETTGIIRIL